MNQAFNRDIEQYHSERITARRAHRGPGTLWFGQAASSRKMLHLNRAAARAADAVNALDPGAAPAAESDLDDTPPPSPYDPDLYDDDGDSDDEEEDDSTPPADVAPATAADATALFKRSTLREDQWFGSKEGPRWCATRAVMRSE